MGAREIESKRDLVCVRERESESERAREREKLGCEARLGGNSKIQARLRTRERDEQA